MPVKMNSRKSNKDIYKCLSCGMEYTALTGNFYKSGNNSPLWLANSGYAPICKTCIDRFKSVISDRYKSEEYAMKVICHYMDWYFSGDAFASLAKNAQQYTPGMYSRIVNNTAQYKSKTFIDSIIDGEISKTNIVAEKNGTLPGELSPPKVSLLDVTWDDKDEKNRRYVIETYGYDPLEDMQEATVMDRKYCYNALSSYCDTEGISEDGHKMMCCVSMVKTFLQIKKLDEEINKVSNDYEIDDARLKNLMASKKQALDTITNLAKDNNISSQWNRNIRAGQGTMSDKIREMYENGFDPSRVNLFDIKTCESIKQTADLSFQSIMDQLQLDENDYTRVIKNQREMVQDMTNEIDRLKEENRQLSNKVLYLEQGGGKD